MQWAKGGLAGSHELCRPGLSEEGRHELGCALREDAGYLGSQAGPRVQRLGSGAELGYERKRKKVRVACGHVNKVESGVMRSEGLSGPRSHRIPIPEEEGGASGGETWEAIGGSRRGGHHLVYLIKRSP